MVNLYWLPLNCWVCNFKQISSHYLQWRWQQSDEEDMDKYISIKHRKKNNIHGMLK